MTHSFNEIRDKFSKKMQDKDFMFDVLTSIHNREEVSIKDFNDIILNLTPLYTQKMLNGYSVIQGMRLYTLGKDGVISCVEICAEESEEKNCPTIQICVSDMQLNAEELFKEQ